MKRAFTAILLLTGPVIAMVLAWPVIAGQIKAQDKATLATAPMSEIARLRPSSLALAKVNRIYNSEAPIPPQCYTKIEGKYNPCYICHQSYDDQERPNFTKDGRLQQAYNFSETGLINHYSNLFVDRSREISKISDREILDWINGDNYSALADDLKSRDWQGYLPDLDQYQDGKTAFDAHGFARDGSGWVAFNYKPLPSTFWPTNGSSDDVAIRLPEKFRSTANGKISRDLYMANLALLEMAFQDLQQTSMAAVDEAAIGTDLDGDGKLAQTRYIKRRSHYLGRASDEKVTRMLYPEGTEFLHSVRYVGFDKDGSIAASRRMKELRYMRKSRFLSLVQLRSRAGMEQQEKIDEKLPRLVSLGDRGLDNGMGWVLQGFIEDRDGALRPQTAEEQFFCRGCHTSVGGNIDQSWAFPRKVSGADGWRYIDYRGMKDVRSIAGGKGEFLTYFERAGGGDEFRSNKEMLKRFFNADGSVNEAAIRGKDVYELIVPSRERALELNKAYKVLVNEQSFLFGRDATARPPENVYQIIDDARAPTLPADKRYSNDIRLDWNN